MGKLFSPSLQTLVKQSYSISLEMWDGHFRGWCQIAAMTDCFRNFQELSQKMVEGVDYNISFNRRERSAFLIVAPRGGTIEYAVTDCSANKPYDLTAKFGTKKLIVEVKGTTGSGEAVLLTHGEVKAQREAYPENCLVVVHSITLARGGDVPVASGGTLELVLPWYIEDQSLSPISYQHTISY